MDCQLLNSNLQYSNYRKIYYQIVKFKNFLGSMPPSQTITHALNEFCSVLHPCMYLSSKSRINESSSSVCCVSLKASMFIICLSKHVFLALMVFIDKIEKFRRSWWRYTNLFAKVVHDTIIVVSRLPSHCQGHSLIQF